MAQITKKNRRKISFTCIAPKALAEYNLAHNKEVEEACYQEPKYEPHYSCIGCKYLEPKEY